jgi:hypothetical protein
MSASATSFSDWHPTACSVPRRCLTLVHAWLGLRRDPYLWQDQEDRSLHILYHNGPHGLHAFSDEQGLEWHKSPTGSHAYGLALNLSDEGGTVELARRERPELLFDEAGRPQFLYGHLRDIQFATSEL